MEIKKRGGEVRQRLADIFDIPKEVALDFPKINLIGNIQLYIENHRGIIEYRADAVRVSVSFGEIEVGGEQLTVRSITRDDLHLQGFIKSIRFIC